MSGTTEVIFSADVSNLLSEPSVLFDSAPTTAAMVIKSPSSLEAELLSCIKRVREDFATNEADYLEDGGLPVQDKVRSFLLESTFEFVNFILKNRQSYSIEDFRITPFARDDGGANLLIDCLKVKRRITLLIRPDSLDMRLSFSSENEVPRGQEIRSPGEIVATRNVSWLIGRG